MTGIFLSSSGLKTESCSHRLKSFSTESPAEPQALVEGPARRRLRITSD
jgi:hypothetical protein